MGIQILWSPHDDKCSQCGLSNPNVRMFTSDYSTTHLCKDCWFWFVLECNIPLGSWEDQISDEWEVDIDMIMSCNTTQQETSINTAMQAIDEDQVSLRA